IKKRIGSAAPDLKRKTEYLLNLPLFDHKFTLEDINAYLVVLQGVKELNPEIIKLISSIFQEVRCIKVDLPDNKSYYLDGQFRTIWPDLNIPYSFSTTLYYSEGYVKKYFQGNSPLSLLSAPGYDTPSQEFFDFILNQDAEEKAILKLTLYNNKLEEIKNITVEKDRKRFFVFGLWPWQFSKFRKVNSIGDYKLYQFLPLKKDFYLAPIEVELMQQDVNKRVTLRGCGLKSDLSGKINLVILSNLSASEAAPERLAELYLSHWPNLEEGLQDFSRKIEFFTYSADYQHSSLLRELLELDKEPFIDIKQTLGLYTKALDFFLRRYFFPSGYEKKGELSEFYKLKARIKITKDHLDLIFQLPEEYPLRRDLEYACRRLNELEVVLENNKRLWFNT
ncbi:MAG: hypothetical protein KJ722_04095, partial [Candidatus Omnitrophica bacterium]|nr:hypothetical protein [Candidatus Omnitrophota bacterium]